MDCQLKILFVLIGALWMSSDKTNGARWGSGSGNTGSRARGGGTVAGPGGGGAHRADRGGFGGQFHGADHGKGFGVGRPPVQGAGRGSGSNTGSGFHGGSSFNGRPGTSSGLWQLPENGHRFHPESMPANWWYDQLHHPAHFKLTRCVNNAGYRVRCKS